MPDKKLRKQQTRKEKKKQGDDVLRETIGSSSDDSKAGKPQEESFNKSEPDKDIEGTTPDGSQDSKPKRKYTKRKGAKIDSALTDLAVKAVVNAILDFVAGRAGQHWKGTASEIENLTRVTSNLLQKYIPDLDKWKEEIAFVTVAGLFIASKMEITKAMRPIIKTELISATPTDFEADSGPIETPGDPLEGLMETGYKEKVKPKKTGKKVKGK